MRVRQFKISWYNTLLVRLTCLALGSGFRLPANTVNLRASSSVFKDMLDLGCRTTEKAEVTLVETGEDVEWIVRYSHLIRVPKFVLSFPACLSTIKALHKYEVSFSGIIYSSARSNPHLSSIDLARSGSSNRSLSVSPSI